MSEPILVTGATGNLGSEVVRLLVAQGQPVRAAVRDLRTVAPAPAGVTYVPFDFMQPATYQAALADVRRLLLVRPPAIGDAKRFINPLIDAAQQAGVEHIVFLSLLGVEKNRVVPHAKIEQHLMASGMTWTMLRASFFMQNLSTTHRIDLQERSEIFLPAGNGATSFIDVRDIAAVAAKALTEPGHANQAYPLTGNEALTYSEVAQIFSQELDRPVVYRKPGILPFVLRMRHYGLGWDFIAVMVGIYTTARLGLADPITPDTQRLLGRAPITMRQFVADYRECWLPKGAMQR